MKSNKFAKDQMGIFFTVIRKAVGQQENIISIILLISLCILPFLKCFKTEYITL